MSGAQRVATPPLSARTEGAARPSASPETDAPPPTPRHLPSPQLLQQAVAPPPIVEAPPAIDLPPAEALPNTQDASPLELSDLDVVQVAPPAKSAALAASPPQDDDVEVVAAPAPAEVAPEAAIFEEESALIVPVRFDARTAWLVTAGVLALLGAAALGLALLRALSASSAAPPKAAARIAATASPTPEQQAPAPAAPPPARLALAPSVTLPQATAEPPAATSNSAIPWDDLPQITAKSCEALAIIGSGPKGLLAGQAVTSAQRAIVRGDTAAAHAAFCTASQLGVTNDTVLFGLARVLFMQSDLSAALEAVDQLIERAPTNKQAFEWRGDILIRMGKFDEAQKAWLKAAGATRPSKLLIDNLIRSNDADVKTALRAGDLSRADRMLRRSIALTSGDPEHCRRLVAILTKNGNAAAAERWRAYLSARGG